MKYSRIYKHHVKAESTAKNEGVIKLNKIRKLLNLYWIIAIIAIVVGIFSDFFYLSEMNAGEWSNNEAWIILLRISGSAFSACQYLAFGIACECLYYIGDTLRDIARMKEPPEDRLY